MKYLKIALWTGLISSLLFVCVISFLYEPLIGALVAGFICSVGLDIFKD